jgi:hypothetical protein
MAPIDWDSLFPSDDPVIDGGTLFGEPDPDGDLLDADGANGANGGGGDEPDDGSGDEPEEEPDDSAAALMYGVLITVGCAGLYGGKKLIPRGSELHRLKKQKPWKFKR